MEDGSQNKLLGREQQEEYCGFLRSVIADIKPYPFLRPEAERLEAVAESVVQQFNIAVFGYMKTGKSTLINALLGKVLAVTDVDEATATINRITHDTGDKLGCFTVHWKDSRQETFPLEKLTTDWTGKSDEVKKRVARTEYLELYSESDLLKDIYIIDTPGIGSVTREHEQAAQQFIKGKESDTLVYVFNTSGKEQDEQALLDYRKGAMPGSSPYNSLGVMHKWDDIFWQSGGDWGDILDKASRLQARMKDLVSEVVPVSAPLALFATLAPDSFFERCATVLAAFADDNFLTRMLKRESKWKQEPECATLWEQAKKRYDMPWPSFRIMLRHLKRGNMGGAEAMRRAVYSLSGMDRLRKCLDVNFISRSAVISQRVTRERAKNVLRDIQFKIEERLKEMERDGDMMQRIREHLAAHGAAADMAAWVDGRKAANTGERKTLKACLLEISKRATEKENAEKDKSNAVDLRAWLDSAPEGFTRSQTDILREFLKNFGTAENDNKWRQDRRLLEVLNPVARLCNQAPNMETRRKAEQLRDCLHSIFINKK